MAGYDMEDVLNGDLDFSDFTADDLLELLFSAVTGPGVEASQDAPDGDVPEDIYAFEGIEAYAGDGNPAPWLYRIRTALLMLYGIASGLMALLILSCFRHLT